jgi:mycothiol synthase
MNVRRPAEGDAHAATEIVVALERHFLGEAEMTVADMLDEWHELDLNGDAWLVEIDGTVAGYGVLFTKVHVLVDAYVHPAFFGRGVGSRLAELAEDAARRRGLTLLRNAVLGADKPAHALLEARGYRLVRHFYRMGIELKEEPPPSEWPGGLRLSRFDEREARAFHAALQEGFADEWDHHPEPFEDWRARRLEGPKADPTLWFTVKDGDEIAAVLVCDEERYGMGWVAAIAVRKPWRRRGLGFALLRHAFGELYSRGQHVIGLAVDAENPTGATRLYERAGMRIIWNAVMFEKELAT